MPYVSTEQEAMEELLNHIATDPLDLLNKWRAGEVNDDTLFVLMQRVLLNVKHKGTRFADPEKFAAMRKPNLPREQRFVNDVIDTIKRLDTKHKFYVSDASYQQLLNLAKAMFEDGLRANQMSAVNIAKGRYGMFHNYSGGKAFTDLIDCITDGSNDE